jgi:hypothetical protein
MTGETIVISEITNQEKLVPAVTYVHGLSQRKAISAWLSFLSVCFQDCRNKIRLSGLLSVEDEAQCLRLLDAIIESYVKVERLPVPVQAELCETAHKLIAGMSREHRAFLEDRFFKICGDKSYLTYWKNLETASCLDDISGCLDCPPSALQLKRSADFAACVIALTVLYGARDDFHERIEILEQTMKTKLGSSFPLDLLGLYLWPLDFSFAQCEDAEDIPETSNEHRALLRAAQSINPDVRVQVCADSLLWSRDIIAWVTDEHDVFIESAFDGITEKFGRGLVNEGGNIITGTAADRFILVAQGSLSNISNEILFRYEMDKRNIQTYVLPDGFLWSRNPRTGKDIVLDSIHIDAVINFIPGRYTTDGRPKLIVDPFYYALVNDTEDFKRFLQQQSVSLPDIVVVDERELYLNLPNFSVLLDRSGNRKFLFNRDAGFTLPRLALKPGLLVQPDTEITAMASSFGSIRCAATMLPESFVKERGSTAISVSDALGSGTKEILVEEFTCGNLWRDDLSRLFVSDLLIQPGRKDIPWEYDEFSQTLFLYVAPEQGADLQQCCRMVKDRLSTIAAILSNRLGIELRS